MYHKILPQRDNTDLTITCDQFKKQMQHLKKSGYNTILLSELIDFIHKKISLPQKSIIITFDDAFSNIIEYAKPVLDDLNFKAVVFVVYNAIDKYNLWDIKKNIEKSNCMSKGELKYLLMSGWEIGSHGLNHLDLTSLTSFQIKNEVKKSKEKLENLLRTGIKSFCYPYGRYNEKIIKEIKKAGYGCACAVESDNFFTTDNLYKLRRIFIKPKDSLFTFKRKISPWYLYYRSLRRR